MKPVDALAQGALQCMWLGLELSACQVNIGVLGTWLGAPGCPLLGTSNFHHLTDRSKDSKPA